MKPTKKRPELTTLVHLPNGSVIRSIERYGAPQYNFVSYQLLSERRSVARRRRRSRSGATVGPGHNPKPSPND